jgi:hypothetical protein
MTEGYPAYHGKPLPSYLRFYDPRNWLTVLIWVFFRPSHLKQYLYQVLPEDLYFAAGYSTFIRTLKLRPIASLLITALIGSVAITLIVTSAINVSGTPIRWGWVAVGVVLGVAASMGLGGFGGVAGGAASGVTSYVMGVVVLGIFGGLAASVAGEIQGNAVPDTALIAAFGVAVGMVYTVAAGIGRGVALGVAIGMVVSVLMGVAIGATFTVLSGIESGMVAGVASGLGVIIGSARIPFWIPEVVVIAAQMMTRRSKDSPLWHPSTWDEMSIIPLPRTIPFIEAVLSGGTTKKSWVVRTLLRNQYQGWAVRRSILQWLTTSDDPCALFYELLRAPGLEEVVTEPIHLGLLRRGIRVRTSLLANLADRPVNYDDFGQNPGVDDQLAWRLTRRFAGTRKGDCADMIARYASFVLHIEIGAALGDFQRILYMTYNQIAENEEILPSSVQQLVQTLRSHPDVPHALELALQWELTDEALSVESIETLVATNWSLGPVPDPLVPEVIAFLAALEDIAGQVRLYQESTSPVRRNAALSQAVGMLQELEESVTRIRLTEGIPLAMVVGRWQKMVGDAAGELGQQTTRDLAFSSPRSAFSITELTSDLWQRKRLLPYDNPYVTGRPVQPPLFVGRRDLLSRIVEQWNAGVIPDSAILYGHRRMGKSSILRNLGEYAPAGSLVVYFDLKSARATIQQPGDLLFNLASAIFDEASKRWPDLAEPDQNSYTNPGAAVVQFRRLVGRVIELLPEHTFLVLALDEFEAIEAAVETGQLTVQIYDWLRALSQTPRLALIMAGLHTLDEMSRNYQQAFFDSYRNEKVSFLTLEASTQLITRPTPDFSLDYEREVVAEIHRLTAGQPLLIQRICSELVSHLNHQLFDLNLERSQRIGVDDLAAVLTDEFLVSESRYFDGIWRDQIAGYPEQQKVLQELAQTESGLLMQQIAILSGLTESATSDALSALQRRDLVIVEQGEWRIIMPLFKRWLQIDGRQMISRNEESDEDQSGTRIAD